MFKNKYIFLFSVVIFLATGLLLFLIFLSFSAKQPVRNAIVTPTGAPMLNSLTPLPAGVSKADNYIPNSSSAIEDTKKSYQVGLLINQLPYNGANFSLYYSFSSARFMLYVNPAASTQGQKEFIDFLNKNNIKDSSWLPNLTITNQKITPVP